MGLIQTLQALNAELSNLVFEYIMDSKAFHSLDMTYFEIIF